MRKACEFITARTNFEIFLRGRTQCRSRRSLRRGMYLRVGEQVTELGSVIVLPWSRIMPPIAYVDQLSRKVCVCVRACVRARRVLNYNMRRGSVAPPNIYNKTWRFGGGRRRVRILAKRSALLIAVFTLMTWRVSFNYWGIRPFCLILPDNLVQVLTCIREVNGSI